MFSPLFGRSVLTFAAGANGNVAPIRAITDSTLTTLNGNHSTGLAVDALGTVYANSNNQISMLPNTIMVFAPGASGDAVPTRTITGSLLDGNVAELGLDGSGNLYALVSSRPGPTLVPDAVLVFAPGASGNATPIRSLVATFDFQFAQATIAVDTAGDVLLTGRNVLGAGSNSVSFYPSTINGSAIPSRVIRGGAQGVFSALGLGFDGVGNLYILSIGDQTVKVYAPGADGLATPLRTIQGISFLPLGLLVDTDGTVYVASTSEAEPTTATMGMILVYAPGANGLATPIRTISGAATQLVFMGGMTFGP